MPNLHHTIHLQLPPAHQVHQRSFWNCSDPIQTPVFKNRPDWSSHTYIPLLIKFHLPRTTSPSTQFSPPHSLHPTVKTNFQNAAQKPSPVDFLELTPGERTKWGKENSKHWDQKKQSEEMEGEWPWDARTVWRKPESYPPTGENGLPSFQWTTNTIVLGHTFDIRRSRYLYYLQYNVMYQHQVSRTSIISEDL